MRYRHYKGGLYELVCEARVEADLAPVIVYRSQDGQYWVRPRDVFFELVELADRQKVPRFVAVDDPGQA